MDYNTAHEILSKDEVYSLIQEAQNGCEGSKERLIECNVALVYKTAHTYKKYLSLEDLVQAGMIGVLETINRFDINKGYAFSTYALSWIKKYMILAIEDSCDIRSHEFNYVSLDEHIGDGVPRHELIECSSSYFTEQLEAADYHKNLLDSLEHKERLIVECRLNDYTRKGIANMFGRSDEWVRQIEIKALMKLRDIARREGG